MRFREVPFIPHEVPGNIHIVHCGFTIEVNEDLCVAMTFLRDDLSSAMRSRELVQAIRQSHGVVSHMAVHTSMASSVYCNCGPMAFP